MRPGPTVSLSSGWGEQLFAACTTRPCCGRGRRQPEFWIFTDFDRLRPVELRAAARVFRQLRDAGCVVLNDPAKVLQRTALLRALERKGINSFRTWRVEDEEFPDRFPVFIRGQSEHFGPLTELLNTADEVRTALDDLVAGGASLHDLIIVEFRAETMDGERFRKMTAFRIGEAIIPGMIIINRHWRAKEGTHRIATDADYAYELALANDYPWRDPVRSVFEIANIEYGRVDFGIVAGRPEIYEINTNPSIAAMATHWNADKVVSYKLMVERYNAALLKLAEELQTPRGRVALTPTEMPGMVKLAREGVVRRIVAEWKKRTGKAPR